MKYLIKFLAIIGLVSMSHVAVAIDNVADGDILEADAVNEVIDATNSNGDDIAAAQQALRDMDEDNDDALNNPPPPPEGEECPVDEVCNGLVEGPVDPDTPAPEPDDPPPPPPVADLDCDNTAVGNPGPGGGLIFVLTEDGCRGLEASEVDLNEGSSTRFGCDDQYAGADGVGYGDGRTNTGWILAAACTDGVDDAADLAYDYRGGGKPDWYLPALHELEEMYLVIGPGADNAGGFVEEGVYWTSTEDSQNRPMNAWSVNFANGNSISAPKDYNRTVRAVRVFDVTNPVVEPTE